MAGCIPNLFIVGAGKAGTSALYAYLGAHKEIFMVPGKELNYFGRDLDYRGHRLAEREYLALFDDAGSYRYRGEASVQYLISKFAALEIKQFSSDARILVMLRNPLDVMHARHAQNVYAGDEPIRDFANALEAETTRRMGIGLPGDVACPEWLYYREWIKFSEQIQRYLSVFGAQRVWIGLFDDLTCDPLSLYKSLMRFLDLDCSSPPVFRRLNQNKYVKSITLQRMVTGRSKVVKFIGKLVLPGVRVRQYVVDRITTLNTEPKPRKPIPSQLRTRLLREVTPEVEALARLIGRDLSHWLR